MSRQLKIAIIGDFNFTFNSHHATNMAIEHSERLLELEVSYYWIRIKEASEMKKNAFYDYDGIWFAPGDSESIFYVTNILHTVVQLEIPVLITGEAFKPFIDLLIANYNLNPNKEKLISENLVDGNRFEPIEVYPVSPQLQKLYAAHTRQELSSSRYSLYPSLINYLKDEVIDIEALNQFEEPEIISLKNHNFCVASMFCPQICSTREMPHPLITAFFNISHQLNQKVQPKIG
ncbi:hypothetical protein [Lishizhenia sp.]|uniref:hypothetical protein n=1 Tax=Lishizhenia sp. TaxID=2497594 RepID=UPI00299DC010|nr:hypothetical protein [Lishizhenia sp.]MDX1444628.1 hypothetical protein [Lishizhenia sp.]